MVYRYMALPVLLLLTIIASDTGGFGEFGLGPKIRPRFGEFDNYLLHRVRHKHSSYFTSFYNQIYILYVVYVFGITKIIN